MAQNKNQHFVPRCHFKPFTLNEKGSVVNLYNLAENRSIENVPVKGQCSGSYFYGDDLKLEKIFCGLEEVYGNTIKQIMHCPDAIGISDLKILRQFAYLQYNRTEAAIKRRATAVQSMDELTHRGYPNAKRPIIDFSHRSMMLKTLKTGVETSVYIEDLGLLLARNETQLDFITSDDPTVLTNRVYLQRLKSKSFGLINVGTQLILPLTPRVCLICYDREAYGAEDKEGIWLPLRKEQDILALNELQYLGCHQNIYFSNWSQSKLIQNEFIECASRRPITPFNYWVGVRFYEDSRGECYRQATEAEIASSAPKIISHSRNYPTPSKWVSKLPFRPEIYGYTNGSAVGFIRKNQIARTTGLVRQKIPRVPSSKYGSGQPKTTYVRTSNHRGSEV